MSQIQTKISHPKRHLVARIVWCQKAHIASATPVSDPDLARFTTKFAHLVSGQKAELTSHKIQFQWQGNSRKLTIPKQNHIGMAVAAAQDCDLGLAFTNSIPLLWHPSHAEVRKKIAVHTMAACSWISKVRKHTAARSFVKALVRLSSPEGSGSETFQWFAQQRCDTWRSRYDSGSTTRIRHKKKYNLKSNHHDHVGFWLVHYRESMAAYGLLEKPS